MNQPTITFVGNLAADVDLRITPSGKAVANVAVVCNPRRPDPGTPGGWIDGTPIFWPCEVWGSLGENAAESLRKGDRVLVTGRVKAYAWTPTDGPNAGTEQRKLQIVVEEIGPSLRFVTTKSVRADRTTGPTNGSETEPPPF